jgi:hypothetical protein
MQVSMYVWLLGAVQCFSELQKLRKTWISDRCKDRNFVPPWITVTSVTSNGAKADLDTFYGSGGSKRCLLSVVSFISCFSIHAIFVFS